MADQKISAMPSAATLTGAELVPLVQSGANVQTTINDLSAFTESTYLGYGNIYVASGATAQTTSGTANTYTTLTCFTTDGPDNGAVTVDAANDRLTLATGIYQITFNATFVATNNHTFLFRCFNSTAATAFANTVGKNHTNSNEAHQVGFSGLISVTGTTNVVVQVASTQTSQPLTVSDANFIAVRVG
jgi:hypothetical protein